MPASLAGEANRSLCLVLLLLPCLYLGGNAALLLAAGVGNLKLHWMAEPRLGLPALRATLRSWKTARRSFLAIALAKPAGVVLGLLFVWWTGAWLGAPPSVTYSLIAGLGISGLVALLPASGRGSRGVPGLPILPRKAVEDVFAGYRKELHEELERDVYPFLDPTAKFRSVEDDDLLAQWIAAVFPLHAQLVTGRGNFALPATLAVRSLAALVKHPDLTSYDRDQLHEAIVILASRYRVVPRLAAASLQVLETSATAIPWFVRLARAQLHCCLENGSTVELEQCLAEAPSERQAKAVHLWLAHVAAGQEDAARTARHLEEANGYFPVHWSDLWRRLAGFSPSHAVALGNQHVPPQMRVNRLQTRLGAATQIAEIDDSAGQLVLTRVGMPSRRTVYGFSEIHPQPNLSTRHFCWRWRWICAALLALLLIPCGIFAASKLWNWYLANPHLWKITLLVTLSFFLPVALLFVAAYCIRKSFPYKVLEFRHSKNGEPVFQIGLTRSRPGAAPNAFVATLACAIASFRSD